MSLDSRAIQAALTSHAQRLGVFDRVTGHEPKNAAGQGLSAAFWVQEIRPVPRRSGLAVTSALLVFNCRLFSNALQEPADEIDPNLLDACDALMSAYSSDFDLDIDDVELDLLGAHGQPLAARAGYITLDKVFQRVLTLTIPMTINNAWTQER